MIRFLLIVIFIIALISFFIFSHIFNEIFEPVNLDSSLALIRGV